MLVKGVRWGDVKFRIKENFTEILNCMLRWPQHLICRTWRNHDNVTGMLQGINTDGNSAVASPKPVLRKEEQLTGHECILHHRIKRQN